MAKYDDMSFKKAFAAARKESGAGKTFMWQGKSYSTNTKEDGAKAAPAAGQRPKARPASIAAKAAGGARPAPGGAGAMPAAKPAKAPARAAQFEPTAKPSQGPKKPADRMAAAKADAAARRAASRAAAGVGASKPAKPAAATPSRAGGMLKTIGEFFEGGGLAGMRARNKKK